MQATTTKILTGEQAKKLIPANDILHTYIEAGSAVFDADIEKKTLHKIIKHCGNATVTVNKKFKAHGMFVECLVRIYIETESEEDDTPPIEPEDVTRDDSGQWLHSLHPARWEGTEEEISDWIKAQDLDVYEAVKPDDVTLGQWNPLPPREGEGWFLVEISGDDNQAKCLWVRRTDDDQGQ